MQVRPGARLRAVAVFLWAGLCLGPALAYAQPGAIRYVAPDGVDAGQCDDPAAPCATPSFAAGLSQDGDELRLAAGLYRGMVEVDVPVSYLGPPASGRVSQILPIISTDLTVRGGYNRQGFQGPDPLGQPTVFDAEGLGRAVYVAGGEVTLEDLTIRNGVATGLGGAGRDVHGGGGILVNDDGHLNARRLVVEDCTGGGGFRGFGGSILVILASMRLEDSVVRRSRLLGDRFSEGGAIFFGSPRRENFIINTTLEDNQTPGNGGALCIGGGSHLWLQGVTLRRNQARTGGSVYFPGGGGDLRIFDSVITDNVASDFGGGLALYRQAQLSGNRIEGNTAVEGGGLGLGGGVGLVRGNLIRGNRASARGGGVYLERNPATLSHNLIVGNTAPTGSGLYNAGVATSLYHTTFLDNGVPSGDLPAGDRVAYYEGPHGNANLQVRFTNTLVVNHSVGFGGAGPAGAILERTLFERVTTPVGDARYQQLETVEGVANLDPETWTPGAGSGAIDAGVIIPLDLDTDFAGGPYPRGAAPDLGAVESALPDVFARLDAPGAALVGGVIDLTAVVGNSGAEPVEAVTLTLSLPAGAEVLAAAGNPQRGAEGLTWALGALAPGGEQRFEVRVQAPAAAADLAFEARVAGPPGGDVNPANDRASQVVNVISVEEVAARTQISLVTAASASPGDLVPVELSVANASPVPLPLGPIVGNIPPATVLQGQPVASAGVVEVGAEGFNVVGARTLPPGEIFTLRWVVGVEGCEGTACGVTEAAATVGFEAPFERLGQSPSRVIILNCPDLVMTLELDDVRALRPADGGLTTLNGLAQVRHVPAAGNGGLDVIGPVTVQLRTTGAARLTAGRGEVGPASRVEILAPLQPGANRMVPFQLILPASEGPPRMFGVTATLSSPIQGCDEAAENDEGRAQAAEVVVGPFVVQEVTRGARVQVTHVTYETAEAEAPAMTGASLAWQMGAGGALAEVSASPGHPAEADRQGGFWRIGELPPGEQAVMEARYASPPPVAGQGVFRFELNERPYTVEVPMPGVRPAPPALIEPDTRGVCPGQAIPMLALLVEERPPMMGRLAAWPVVVTEGGLERLGAPLPEVGPGRFSGSIMLEDEAVVSVVVCPAALEAPTPEDLALVCSPTARRVRLSPGVPGLDTGASFWAVGPGSLTPLSQLRRPGEADDFEIPTYYPLLNLTTPDGFLSLNPCPCEAEPPQILAEIGEERIEGGVELVVPVNTGEQVAVEVSCGAEVTRYAIRTRVLEAALINTRPEVENFVVGVWFAPGGMPFQWLLREGWVYALHTSYDESVRLDALEVAPAEEVGIQGWRGPRRLTGGDRAEPVTLFAPAAPDVPPPGPALITLGGVRPPVIEGAHVAWMAHPSGVRSPEALAAQFLDPLVRVEGISADGDLLDTGHLRPLDVHSRSLAAGLWRYATGDGFSGVVVSGEAPPLTDSDGDTLLDIEEGAAEALDHNNDGQPDVAQAHVGTFTGCDGQPVSFTLDAVEAGGAPGRIDGAAAWPAAGRIGLTEGLIAPCLYLVRIQTEAVGDAINVRITAPEGFEDWAIEEAHWWPGNGEPLEVQRGPAELIIGLVDGGAGDLDGLTNGVIIHRGGPARPGHTLTAASRGPGQVVLEHEGQAEVCDPLCRRDRPGGRFTLRAEPEPGAELIRWLLPDLVELEDCDLECAGTLLADQQLVAVFGERGPEPDPDAGLPDMGMPDMEVADMDVADMDLVDMGPPDAMTPDMDPTGAPDATPRPDAAQRPDATPDGGDEGFVTTNDGGCSCDVGESRPGAPWLWLALLLWPIARRRRQAARGPR